MQVTFRDGKAIVSYDYPPEEQVESAAARVRPLLLADVSMPSVLNAIKSLTAESGDRELIRAWIKQQRELWNRRTGSGPSEAGYLAFYESTETGETGATDHMQLALAWIYGDVVHHDPEHLERTRYWGVGERFRAAVPLVAYLMIEAINVLNNIREMERRGALTVSEEASTVAIVAEDHYEHEAQVYVGEAGAEAPASAAQPLGANWKPFDLSEFVFAETDAPADEPDQSTRSATLGVWESGPKS